MKRVTGIENLLQRERSRRAWRAWYKQHLGIDVQEWGGTAFTWDQRIGHRQRERPCGPSAPLMVSTSHPSKATFMVNYRVEDLALSSVRFGRKMQRPGEDGRLRVREVRLVMDPGAQGRTLGSHLRDSEFHARRPNADVTDGNPSTASETRKHSVEAENIIPGYSQKKPLAPWWHTLLVLVHWPQALSRAHTSTGFDAHVPGIGFRLQAIAPLLVEEWFRGSVIWLALRRRGIPVGVWLRDVGRHSARSSGI